jgi:hypothetical protein
MVFEYKLDKAYLNHTKIQTMIVKDYGLCWKNYLTSLCFI